MVTSVGKFLRKLRIDRCEILKTMAESLGVSSAFLSAIENGKKKFPDTLLLKLQEAYNLSPEQMEELKLAIMESSNTLELNIQNSTDKNRQLAISFARQFNTLDEETSKKIFNILNKNDKEG